MTNTRARCKADSTLKLIDALKIIQRQPENSTSLFDVHIACGFNALHLLTFISAYVRLENPAKRVQLHTGLYGDFGGSLAGLQREKVNAGIVVLEWPDLDPRLGLRQIAGWGVSTMPDILQVVDSKLRWIEAILSTVPDTMPVVLSLPTLPLPPVAYTAGGQASLFDLELRRLMITFAVRVAEKRNLRVLDAQRLDELSPLGARYDVKAELSAGFPYSLPHASVLALQITRLLHRGVPMKGLITDLDDTLWSGIVGDDGVRAVSWDLDHKSQVHALFQQLLRALADEGVLLAVASRNERSIVEEALSRRDMILPKDKLFPIEVSWKSKSEAVSRILETWSVMADSVVFVDDSATELAEVKTAHPDIICLEFPKEDPQSVYRLLVQIRDLFSKDHISEEDRIRLDSVRQSEAAKGSQATVASPEEFLRGLDAEVTLDFQTDPLGPRTLELINKTNQFNLNGERHTDASWMRYLAQDRTFSFVVAYRDKFGSLGRIAVLAGRHESGTLRLDTWVMSCRAFGRRIEYCCLEQLFLRFPVNEIILNFVPTPRNVPLREFLTEFLGETPTSAVRLSRDRFRETRPPLYHRIRVVARE